MRMTAPAAFSMPGTTSGQDIQAGGMAIEFYYGRKHQAVMEAAGAADAVRSVVDYCTERYGPCPSALAALKLIQSRVAGGGYATPVPACWTRRTLPPPICDGGKRGPSPAR